jgi:hypothetical protein
MKAVEKRLLKLFDQLAAPERDMLLAFAEFLSARASGAAQAQEVPMEPLDLPRPENETVIAAIKRLNASYPMLESRRLLDETSMLMSQHVLQGRDVNEVIDELESLFLRHYEQLRDELTS